MANQNNSYQNEPYPVELSERDKQRSIDHIEKKIAKLQLELDKIYPKNSRFRDNVADLRDQFIEHWCKLQSRRDGPIGPMGRPLKYSTDIEKIAHEKLKISNFIKPDAPFRPFDPYEK